MARFLKYAKGSRFFPIKIGAVLLLVILVWGFINQNTVPRRFRPYISFAYAQSENAGSPNGSGFLWTDTAGWISMNCENDWNGDGPPLENRCGSFTYGARVDFAVGTGKGTLSGYGWSPNVGLVCFGRTCGGCSGISCGGAALGTEVYARFDTDDAQEVVADGVTRRIAFIHGFARILAHANEGGTNLGGWIDLEGRGSGTDPDDGGVGAFLDNTTLALAGSGWQQNDDRTGIGWVYFGDSPPGNSPCTDETCRTICNLPDDPSCAVIFPPERESECADGSCCSNGKDDDNDKNYALDSIHNPADRDEVGTTGVDCLDYDCAGAPDQRFYSTTYNSDPARDPIRAPEHCGVIPPQGNVENAFPEDCFDGFDNDLDAYLWDASARRFVLNPDEDAGVDCTDADCELAVQGASRCGAENCYDIFDNDGDGEVDCDDPGCNDPATGFVLCPGRAVTCLCDRHARAIGLGLEPCTVAQDPDGDGVRTIGTDGSACDNCPGNSNSGQEDTDADGIQETPGDGKGGDACDPVSWLETREGSLYAQLLSGTPPPVGFTTATYCILTATGSAALGQFRSGQCSALPDTGVSRFQIIPGLSEITLVSGTGQNSVRAHLDLQPLRPGARGVVTLTQENAAQTLSELASRRYYYQGDLTINQTVTWPAGSGGVTILVDGNLHFGPNAGLFYDREAPVAGLSDITSVAWIVNGDIIVDPNVGSATPDLAGTFLSTGTFFTGTKAPAPDKSLTIAGLVIAHEFRLQRQFTSPDRGSELIIYDGRAVLNSPPGLDDLVKALPTFRSIAPQ